MIRQADYRDLDWGNIKSGGSIGMLSKTIIKKGGKNYYVKISAYNKHHWYMELNQSLRLLRVD